MWFAIVENHSGEIVELRKLKGTDSADPADHLEAWANREGVTIAKSDGYIPAGCGDYSAETRDHKFATAVCWKSVDFYLQGEGE